MLCGSYCLYVSLDSLGFAPGTFEEFRHRLGEPSRVGYSLLQLARCAESYGAKTAALETNLRTLRRVQQPHARVALFRSGHFVLVSGYDDNTVEVIDPPHEYTIPRKLFEARWAGDILLISPTQLPNLSERNWWPWLALLTGLLAVSGAFYLFRKLHRTTKDTTP
jgi:ABC-type bacteriocin/lantibiotic exporter with double-glycine peptidase domain